MGTSSPARRSSPPPILSILPITPDRSRENRIYEKLELIMNMTAYNLPIKHRVKERKDFRASANFRRTNPFYHLKNLDFVACFVLDFFCLFFFSRKIDSILHHRNGYQKMCSLM